VYIFTQITNLNRYVYIGMSVICVNDGRCPAAESLQRENRPLCYTNIKTLSP